MITENKDSKLATIMGFGIVGFRASQTHSCVCWKVSSPNEV